jgi:hypothetical protein
MYSKVAVRNVVREYPAAKIIVMLRNPTDIAVSMHAQMLYNGEENISSFEKAWRACHDRSDGRNLPPKCRDKKILLYDRVALLGAQLEALVAIVPREQIRWWFYDDWAVDPRALYLEVLAFLGLEDDSRLAFPKINERKERLFGPLTWFTQRTPQPLVRAAISAKQVLGIERLGILDIVRRFNSRPARVASLAEEFNKTLNEHFAGDIDLLARLTGRNLDHWKRAARAE